MEFDFHNSSNGSNQYCKQNSLSKTPDAKGAVEKDIEVVRTVLMILEIKLRKKRIYIGTCIPNEPKLCWPNQTFPIKSDLANLFFASN